MEEHLHSLQAMLAKRDCSKLVFQDQMDKKLDNEVDTGFFWRFMIGIRVSRS